MYCLSVPDEGGFEKMPNENSSGSIHAVLGEMMPVPNHPSSLIPNN